ncbi:neutral zinc metallopeptidase [Kribbella sp. NPDC026611]|uniref:neutral zinc metallopeptidase n=1 Tax=Kribbella sp. NPDC026611 TaxID=3154911 RepID=UPI0033DFF137
MADKPAPKVGHFLPGGEGDHSVTESAPKPSSPNAAPLSAPTPRLGGDAPPTPPQLQGTRIESKRTSLSGSRLGPPPVDDAAAEAYRRVFHPDPIPFVPKKRSKALIAGIVIGALILVGGGLAFAAKVLTAYDGPIGDPGATPSARSSNDPSEPVTKGTPDAEVLAKSPLYAAGAMSVVKCQEPAFRPTSMENVRSYYQALIGCLDRAWKPVVEKAGFEFRSPQLVLFSVGNETACGVQNEEVESYCPAEAGSVAMPWQELTENYPQNKALTRAAMAQAIGFVYSTHVQNLMGILDASQNQGDSAANKAAELEQKRRASLQASCLSAAFFGAAKASFPLRGEVLRQWTYLIQHGGDEHTKTKVRDHGSAKSLALWMNQGFATTNPGSCNTFVAASAKVS